MCSVDIKSAVILSIIPCMCSVIDISATLTQIGVQFCTMVDMGPAHSLPFLGAPPEAPKSQILIANISKI